MVSEKDFKTNLDRVRESILAAGRSLNDVRIIAVTKGFGIEAIERAAAVGLTDVGENYTQECRPKYTEAVAAFADAGLPMPRLHFLGKVQINKVRKLQPLVSVWHSVHSRELIDELAKRVPHSEIFIQRNMTDDPFRGGCTKDEVLGLVDYAVFRGMNVVGLMCVASQGDRAMARQQFRALREQAYDVGVRRLSMGMSEDYVEALEEGATELRLGRALFGDRPGRDDA